MKNMKKLFCFALAVVMLLSVMAGCAAKTEQGSSTTQASESTASTETASNESADASDAAATDGEIDIAFIGNTTGDYAQYGIPVRNAVMLYFDQLNAAGGINGKKVVVKEYDDKGDGVEAVNAYNLAKENGITAVIGSVLTGATIGLADATYEDNMPQITASATATGVTVMEDTGEVRTNVFRACFIDPFQGQKMADYAVEKLGAKTAAIFYETGSDYSEGLKNAFVVEAERMGLEIVDTEAFATGDKDFKAQMTNIASKNPDIVFCPIYYGEAGLAIQAARQAGCTATFLGGDGFGSVKDYASAEELEGSVYCSGYAPGTEDVAQFEKDYCETFGVEEVPNMFAPLAYDASMIMAYGLKAAEDAGLEAGTDEYKQAVIDAIKTMDGVKGITGTYSFDSDNNPIKSVAIIELTGGEEVFKEMF
ncbi:Branched-chain amino acid ABC transporter, substrate-binding protein LivJ (TC 3.A.1.4.1) [Oscillospiraceae bacterium]|nr:Branched-chain amino acid ABC transporter, substrate-binding protein LivJ (TC 3.A.1.4.1) [Oscillospiraceae bacterium]